MHICNILTPEITNNLEHDRSPPLISARTTRNVEHDRSPRFNLAK